MPPTKADAVERARRNNSAPTKPHHAPVVSRSMGVIADLMDGLTSRPTLHDFFLLSNCGVRVGAARFLLSCRSPILEELLEQNPDMMELELNYSVATLQAALEYIVTNELSKTLLAADENAATIRGLVQLSHLGETYRIAGLYETAFRIIRVVVNKIPALALAVYDEVAQYEFESAAKYGNRFAAKQMQDDSMETYALQIIADAPFTALHGPGSHGPGVQYLSINRLEALCCNKLLQLEEVDFFHALVKWCEVVLNWSSRSTAYFNYQQEEQNGDAKEKDDAKDEEDEEDIKRKEEQRDRVKEIAKTIELRFIEPSELITTVKDSELVDYTSILEAMADQALEAQLMDGKEFSNYRGNQYLERVVVRDAGSMDVNGIYLRQDKEDFRDYEALYLKTSERRNGEYGLFIWNAVWNIAPLADLSNVCYTCHPVSDSIISATASMHNMRQAANHTAADTKPPAQGWEVSPNGTAPPPNCRMLPVRDAGRTGHHNIRASLPSCYRNSLDFLGN
jgi:hypothetical protein